MLKNYSEILDLEADGLCNSCDYGIDKCLNEGRAFCKHYEEIMKEKEDLKDVEKEFV